LAQLLVEEVFPLFGVPYRVITTILGDNYQTIFTSSIEDWKYSMAPILSVFHTSCFNFILSFPYEEASLLPRYNSGCKLLLG